VVRCAFTLTDDAFCGSPPPHSFLSRVIPFGVLTWCSQELHVPSLSVRARIKTCFADQVWPINGSFGFHRSAQTYFVLVYSFVVTLSISELLGRLRNDQFCVVACMECIQSCCTKHVFVIGSGSLPQLSQTRFPHSPISQAALTVLSAMWVLSKFSTP